MPFVDVEVAEPVTMSTNKAVGRFERVEPLTKTYWITMVFGSLLCIPCIAFPVYHLLKYGDMLWTVQMACYSVMWEVFVVSEMFRFALKQRHTARAVYLGGLILVGNIISYVVLRALEAKANNKE